MRRTEEDRGRRDPPDDSDEERIELVDSEGTLIHEGMVQVLSPTRPDEWDVRADERTR